MSIDREPVRWFYRLSCIVFRTYFRWKFGYRIHDNDRVPGQGGLLIASNHASFLDPPLVGTAVANRMVRFLARDTLFKNAILRWFMNNVGVVPLDRERGDIGALKTAVKLLKDGQCVALFPEGTRTLDGNLQSAKGGTGFLIHKADVPVVPAYIDGSFEAFPKGADKVRRHPVAIYFGHPITPEELHLKTPQGKTDYEAISALVMERIAALRPPARTTS